MKHVFVGTSGYNYREWRNTFYPPEIPQKLWLPYYSEQFPTVEINNTFYTSVEEHVYRNWFDATPKHFVFSIKGNRYITHLKQLKDVGESVERFFKAVRNLEEKLHIVLWQFPKHFVFKPVTLSHLEIFLTLLPKDYLYAFEFRNKAWFGPATREVLKRHNASLVISQSSVFPEVEHVTATFVYVRFHGPGTLYSSGYSEKELNKWVKKIKKWQKRLDVYCYFNNDAGGYAVRDAKKLIELVH